MIFVSFLLNITLRVRADFGEFWKAMELENAIFQDLESLEKRGFLKWLWKSFGFLFGKILKIS